MSYSSKTNSVIERMRPLSPLCGGSDKELAFVDRLTYEFNAPAGTVLVSEGDGARGFFLIVSGLVEISVAGTAIAKLGPGTFFGEIAILDLGPEPATATVIRPSVLRVATRREFRELMSTPRIANALMLTLAARERVALGYRQLLLESEKEKTQTPLPVATVVDSA